MGGIIDRLAAAETYPDLIDIPTRTAFKGFKKVHVAVGTSDLSSDSHASSFWYLDTEEILSFFNMMGIFGFIFTLLLWFDLGFMRWQTTNAAVNAGYWQGTAAWYAVSGRSPPAQLQNLKIERFVIPPNGEAAPIEVKIVQIHFIGVVAGWTAWILIASLVGIHQVLVTTPRFVSAPPELVRRTSDAPWIPRHNSGPGIRKEPVFETKPRPWCFCAPIYSIHDGNCLYAHCELVDDVVFGDTVPDRLKKQREVFKERLKRWYPPSLSRAIDWALSRRTILEDPYTGAITKPRPLPGRYYIDQDVPCDPEEIMKGKELRRLVWMLLVAPAAVCSLVELYTLFTFRQPTSLLMLLCFVVAFVSSAVIFWIQFGKWGAKKLEAWDRGRAKSENVFSKHGAHHS